ncbi:A/G-specific adenine glycosylase, partial [Campylobacter sp. BCW_8712]
DESLKHIDRAYGVYISEIMLQQTQVKSVLERFYFPFLQKFPTLESLANANEDELLKAWQGLGYYTRARNLKKAALECVDKFGAKLPKEVEDLKKLSG